MSYKIEITQSAAREFKKLLKSIKNKIEEVVGFLSQNPRSEFLNIKRMKGAEDLYRIRVGDYRLVYEVKDSILLIIVIKIGHRKEVYRRR